MNLRQINSRESEFEAKRYKARADYLYATVGLQRTQSLPAGMNLLVKVDGQFANEPLIDNEQYSAGGMESVRGYKETEQAGDNSVHGMFELSFPDPLERSPAGKWIQMSPFLFYDFAVLTIIDPLPTQAEKIRLAGTGAGVRGAMWKHLEYEVDWSVALKDTDITKRDDERVYFKVKAEF
jgi:hemolysin activation/secretion protein